MKPQHIELVVTIAQMGSLGAAAVHLNKTQPAITKALKAVEEDLGTPIFYRGARGVSATPVGQAVIARCEKIYNELRRLDQEVRQFQGDLTGAVDVIVSPLAATKIIPGVMRRFEKRFPRVEVNLSGGHSPRAFAPLRQGHVDFVVGPAPEKSATLGLNVTKLFSTPITFVTGKNSKYANETDPQVIAKARWIMVGPKDRRPLFLEYFEELGITPPVPFVKSDSILSILSMLEDSDFLCAFASLPLPDVQRRWDIAVVPITQNLPIVTIALTSNEDSISTPAVNAFADIVKAYCEGMDKT